MKCVSYLRVSSDRQADKDGPERQREAIAEYARLKGHEVVAEFPDLGVSGASKDRPQLDAALDYCKANGITLLLVESADRWGRDVIVSETLSMDFRNAGIRVWSVKGCCDLTESEDEDAVMVRQMLAAVSQNVKSKLVRRMKLARDRMSVAAGRRIEGRKKQPRGKATAELIRLGLTGMPFEEVAAKLNKRNLLTSGYTDKQGRRVDSRPWSDAMAYKEWDCFATAEQKAEREMSKHEIITNR